MSNDIYYRFSRNDYSSNSTALNSDIKTMPLTFIVLHIRALIVQFKVNPP